MGLQGRPVPEVGGGLAALNKAAPIATQALTRILHPPLRFLTLVHVCTRTPTGVGQIPLLPSLCAEVSLAVSLCVFLQRDSSPRRPTWGW